MTKYEDYILQNPKNQLFYRILGLIMAISATGDMTLWGFSDPNLLIRLNRNTVIIFAPIVFASQIAYLFMNFEELTFNTLGIMFSIIPVTFLVNACLICSRLDANVKVMKDFMTRIHLYNYQDQHEFPKDILRIIERMSRWTFYYLLVFLMIDWAAWIVVTGLNNIRSRSLVDNNTVRLETVVYLVLPFDYEHNFNIWIIYHSIVVYLVWIGCIVIAIFNSLNFIFVFHLVGHINILKQKLKKNFLDAHNDEEIKLKLVDFIKYHSFVLT